MRFLHTADWHIGKIVNDFSMLEYQKDAIDQIIQLLLEKKYDGLIIAGDLYDRINPSSQAMELVHKQFQRILFETQTPILLTSGNHDSNQFIEYSNYLTQSHGLYSEGLIKESMRKVTFGDTDIYLFPFITPFQYSKIMKDPSIKTFNDVFVREIEKIELTNKQNVLVTHGYFIKDGIVFEKEDSVRPLSIGTAEYVDATIFDKFDYVACGHLHSAHHIGSKKVQYSGSLLKYSKSEANNKIGVNEVNLINNQLEVTRHFLKPKKDLIVLRGELDDLLKQPCDDFVFYELLDTQLQLDAMNRLKAISPYAMGLSYEKIDFKRHQHRFDQKQLQSKSLIEMFEEFYNLHQPIPLSKTQLQIMTDLVKD